MSGKRVIIMNEQDVVLREEVFCNSLTSKENLVNCILFNNGDYLYKEKNKEVIAEEIRELKYGYLYEDNNLKYWIRK